MINYGTLAKTYSGTQIITGRNDCHDSYIMKNGTFYLVPSGKQYGLKAFRTWFSYVPDGTAAKPTTLLFSINGITDTTAGIADIFPMTSCRRRAPRHRRASTRSADRDSEAATMSADCPPAYIS